MLQIGFAHSTWTKFTFSFHYLLLEPKVVPDFVVSGFKFHNCGPLQEISVPNFRVFLVKVESC